ncbi:MAG: NAD-dependent protein deacetylase [Pseudomonadales bacterium]
MSLTQISDFVQGSQRLFVITGAGLSAPSGIGTYRDHSGCWQRSEPIRHQDFLEHHEARQRYWARSMRGWPAFRDARPNAAHEALVTLEGLERIQTVLTQNVDGLHQRAGQTRLIELHGNLGAVVCLDCGLRTHRDDLQARLEAANGEWLQAIVAARPDGDAEYLSGPGFTDFTVPGCHCGGTLKPDVVFYGDSVPRSTVEAAYAELARADAMLVVGSSLMVYSSYRFVKAAAAGAVPVAAINLGRTRGDAFFRCKWEADVAVALPALVASLCPGA